MKLSTNGRHSTTGACRRRFVAAAEAERARDDAQARRAGIDEDAVNRLAIRRSRHADRHADKRLVERVIGRPPVDDDGDADAGGGGRVAPRRRGLCDQEERSDDEQARHRLPDRRSVDAGRQELRDVRDADDGVEVAADLTTNDPSSSATRPRAAARPAGTLNTLLKAIEVLAEQLT